MVKLTLRSNRWRTLLKDKYGQIWSTWLSSKDQSLFALEEIVFHTHQETEQLLVEAEWGRGAPILYTLSWTPFLLPLFLFSFPLPLSPSNMHSVALSEPTYSYYYTL